MTKKDLLVNLHSVRLGSRPTRSRGEPLGLGRQPHSACLARQAGIEHMQEQRMGQKKHVVL